MPDPRTPTPDASRCTLCGEPNGCAMEAAQATGRPQPPCWCMTTAIDPAALARIPAARRGLACICRRCATSAAADPAAPATPVVALPAAR